LKLYAELPGRRLAQLALDVVLVAVVALSLWAGREMYELVELLSGPGRSVEQAGSGFAGAIDRFADRIGGLPGVGGDLREPLDSVSGAGRTLERAGRSQQEVVHRLALALGLVVAGFPIMLVVAVYLPRRARWVREASAAARLRRADAANLHLFALRAAANRSYRALRRVSADPAGDLERGEYAALAVLELRMLGLRLDRGTPQAARS
jgi:hypothetical protein